MNGHLSALGIHVPRARLRASIHRVDPINTALRRSIVVRRRVYHVSGPNAVWHIDGNHQLIIWRMVIHGSVDGYSQTIVYLKCAQNNRADTVMVAFNEAVDEYGLPERVRSDLGGENVEVWRFMIEQHSSESSVITGSSTHNERIERLWRDVTRSVGSYFYATFQELELNGHLDVLNEIDMFCLHYTYIPRLNHFLKVFTECWNNHSLSSEHNQTPNQLYVQGIVHQQNQPNFTQIVGQSRNLTLPAVRDTVTVPGGTFQPCRALMTSLNAVINTTTSGVEDNCKSTYIQVVNIVGSHLQFGCNNCTE